jgi:hypothetical protein
VTQELKSSPRSRTVNVSKSHIDTHQVEIFWTTDQPFADDATCTTHNKHKIPTSMPSAVFEPAVPAFKRLQTCALDRTAPGTSEASTGFLITRKNNSDSETI